MNSLSFNQNDFLNRLTKIEEQILVKSQNDDNEYLIIINELKNIIHDLKFEDNNYFRTTLYSIGDAVITTDKDGLIKNINPIAERLTGWKEIDAINKPLDVVFNIINEISREKVENPIKNVLSSGQIVNLVDQTLLIDKKGNEYPISDSGSPILNEKNEIIGVVIVFRDQTHERDLQNKLISSQQQYKDFVEKSKEGIFYITYKSPIDISLPIEEQAKLIIETGYIHTCNDALAKMYNYKDKNEVIGKSFIDFYGEEFNQTNYESVLKIILNNYNIEDVESEEYDANGNKKYFLNSVSGIIKDNKFIGNWGVQRDITELKNMQIALAENEKKYRMIAENTADTLTISDFDFTIKYISPSICKLRGFTAEEAILQKAEDIMTPESIAYATKMLLEEFEKENKEGVSPDRTITIELQQYHKNGTLIWVQNRSSFLRDNNGKPTAILSVSSDITQRKQTEKELIDSKLKAEKNELIAKAFFEQSPISIQIFDKNGITINVNQAWEIQWDIKANEVINKYNLFEDPFMKNYGWLDNLKIAFEGKTTSFFEKEYNPSTRNKQGSIKYLQCLAFPIIINDIVEQVIVRYQDITDRKFAQIRLEESEREFKQIFNSTNEAIFVHNPNNGEIIDVNDQAILIYNFESKDDLLQQTLKEITFNDEFYYIEKAIDYINLANQGNPQTFLWKSKKKDGSFFWSEVSLKKAILGGNDRVLAVVRDITERKSIEKKLIESERRMLTLLTNLPGMTYRCKNDKDWTMEFVSNGSLELTGYLPEDLINNKTITFNSLILNQYQDHLWEQWQIILAEKSKLNEEYQIVTKNGELKWVWEQGCGVYSDTGEVIALEGIIIDVTSKKRTEETLIESEKTFRYLFESSSDPILLIKDDRFVECNKAALKILGDMPRHKLINSKPLDISPKVQPDGRLSAESSREKILIAMQEGHLRFDWEHLKTDGSSIIVNVMLMPISIKGEKLLHVTWRDVTIDRIIRKELIEAKEKSEISDKLKSEFLAQISHEIRTPINAILSFSHLIRDELYDKIDNDLQDGFNTIQKAGRRIIRTIDLILNMSEVQSGSYDYVGKEIDVYRDIINANLDEYKILAKDKNLTLSIKKETENTFTYGDEYAISQIFQNLIDNAIKYTLEGGIEILLNRNTSNKLFIAITDTGIGISEEYIPNLFKAFSQEEQGYTRKFEGNGLGLALIKKYCELNNATITVDSIKNVGSTFTVTFENLKEILL